MKTAKHPEPAVPAKRAKKDLVSPAAKPAATPVAKSTAKRAGKAAAKPAAAASGARKPKAEKPVRNTDAKPVAKAPAKVGKPSKSDKPAKPKALRASAAKPPKVKTVHAKFSLHPDEYQVLRDLKEACRHAAWHVRKSEIVRAALMLLKNVDVAAVKVLVEGLPALKPGAAKKA